MASPLSPNDHHYSTWNYIFIRHMICVLSVESLLDTPFLESQKLCYACSYASLKFIEPWTCSSTSLISFWAWCALLILKKFSHASLRFIWEFDFCLINSLLLHLDYFERKHKIYAHDLHLYLFELIKSNMWNIVPKW